MSRAIVLTAIMYLLMFYGQAAADVVAHVHDDMLAARQTVQMAGVLAAAE